MTKCRYCKRELDSGKTLCGSPICNAKAELNSYRYKMREAEEMAEDVAELRCRAVACGNAASDAGGHSASRKNTFEERQAKYLDLKAVYEQMRMEAYDAALQIEGKIRELENPFKEILRLRYIKLLRFEEIALKLNYDYRWIKRLHQRAIKMYAE